MREIQVVDGSMGKQQPTIDLAGYQRLAPLERQVWYSPLSVTIYLIALRPPRLESGI
jgi:hypothetical protein